MSLLWDIYQHRGTYKEFYAHSLLIYISIEGRIRPSTAFPADVIYISIEGQYKEFYCHSLLIYIP